MAKVYDQPTYVFQVKNVISTMASISKLIHKRDTSKINDKCGISQEDILVEPSLAAFLSGLGHSVDILDSEIEPTDLSGTLNDARRAYEYGMRMNNDEKRFRAAQIGHLYVDYFNEHVKETTTVLMDQEARFDIIGQYLAGKLSAVPKLSDHEKHRKVSNMTDDVVTSGLISSLHGTNVLNTWGNKVNMFGFTGNRMSKFRCTRAAFEALRVKSITKACSLAHRELELSYTNLDLFDCTATNAAFRLGATSLHRIGPLFLISYKTIDKVYIIDHASITQLLECAIFWEGAAIYAENYRVCGGGESPDLANVFLNLAEWIGVNILDCGPSGAYKIPRAMKIGYHRLMNMFHVHDSAADFGELDRDEQIAEGCLFPNGNSWFDKVTSSGLKDRVQMEAISMLHGLPAPDYDLNALYDKLHASYTNPRPYDKHKFAELMNFRKSCDLARAVYAFKGKVNYKIREDLVGKYDPQDEKWWSAALENKNVVPPREAWGKAWIFGHFTASFDTSQWFYEAGDVTRVVPNNEVYSSVLGMSWVEDYEHNELLYALKKAPMIADGWSPQSANEVFSGDRPVPDQPNVAVNKCENTKYGEKGRGTLSGDAVTRELTSLVDKSAVGLASLYGGVTSRKGVRDTEGLFIEICEAWNTSARSHVISNDAATWSDLAPREAWAVHHKYVMETNKSPPVVDLNQLWANTQVFVDKRGVVRSFRSVQTMYQGWTGTMDSLLNDIITLYAYRTGKEAGYIPDDSFVQTAALIDDAIQAIHFEPNADLNKASANGKVQLEHTRDIWKAMGAELDMIKTMFSDHAWVYLNRFYCHGSEVLTAWKVFAKADREFNRRFASLIDKIDTILGSYRAAVGRGADPIVSYSVAIHKCMDLVQSTAKISEGPEFVVNTVFAPRGMGGLGLPNFASFITNEIQDDLTHYIGVIGLTCEYLMTNPHKVALAKSISKVAARVLTQKTDDKCFDYLCMTPRSVKVANVPDPKKVVNAKLEAAMSRFTDSPVFRQVMSLENCSIEFFKQIAQSGVWDANILEAFIFSFPMRAKIALVARASKSELLVKLLSFKDSDSIRKSVVKENMRLVQHISKLDDNDVKSCADRLLQRNGLTDLASDVRDQYYSCLEVEIVNHTIPCYATCYTQTTGDATLKATFEPPISRCFDKGYYRNEDYVNLYDGRPVRGIMKPVKSAGAKIVNDPRYKVMSIVEKCVMDEVALFVYIQTKSGADKTHTDFLWSLFCKAWGVSQHEFQPSVSVHYREDAATKRIGGRTAKTSHVLLPFPNTQGCVTVDTNRLFRYLDSVATVVDGYSIAASIRALFLIENACSATPITEIRFNVTSDALIIRSSTTFELYPESNVDQILCAFRSEMSAYNLLITSTMHKDLSGGSEDTEQLEIWLNKATDRGAVSVANDLIHYTGDLRKAYFSAYVPRSARKYDPTNSIIDERPSGEWRKIRARIRRYKEKISDTEAIVSAVLDDLNTHIGLKKNPEILTCSWQNIESVVFKHHPYVTTRLIQVCLGIKDLLEGCDFKILQEIFLERSLTQLIVFLNPDQAKKNTTRKVAALCVAYAYGRFMTEAQHKVCFKRGPYEARRLYRNKARRKANQDTRVGSECHFLSLFYNALADVYSIQRTPGDAVDMFDGVLMDTVRVFMLFTGMSEEDIGRIPGMPMDILAKNRKKNRDVRIYKQSLKEFARRLVVNTTGTDTWLYERIMRMIDDYAAMVLTDRRNKPEDIETRDYAFLDKLGDVAVLEDPVDMEVDDENSGRAVVEKWKSAVVHFFNCFQMEDAMEVMRTHVIPEGEEFNDASEIEYEEVVSELSSSGHTRDEGK